MNVPELVSDLPLGPGEVRSNLLFARLLMHYLGDHLRDVTLADGRYLCSVGDFVALCQEVVEEIRKIGHSPESTEVSLRLECGTGTKVTSPAPQRRYSRSFTCPDCDHEHEGREECGKYLGEGKFCHCPSKVAA